jgi:hypothetical protein
MLPTTLLALLTLPLLVLSASPHNSRSGRPHANLASSVNNNQKRIYGLPVQMDTIIPGNSPSLDARKIVVPDHITEEDLYRRELFLSRQKREAAGGEVETGGRMLRKRASCSSKTTAAAAPPATNKVMHAVSTTAKADTPASTAVTYKSGWTSASTNGQSLAVTPLQHISLAEAVKATKGETPSFSNAPDGSWALAANYKAGGVGADAGCKLALCLSLHCSFRQSGRLTDWLRFTLRTGSYYANGPVDISSAREVELTYKVFFANGFTWVKGGKRSSHPLSTFPLLFPSFNENQLNDPRVSSHRSLIQSPECMEASAPLPVAQAAIKRLGTSAFLPGMYEKRLTIGT